MSDSLSEIAYDLEQERKERMRKQGRVGDDPHDRPMVKITEPIADAQQFVDGVLHRVVHKSPGEIAMEHARSDKTVGQLEQELADGEVTSVNRAAEHAWEELERLANRRQVGGSHYSGGQRQHWDVVVEFDLDYFQGNVSKYLFRWRKKNGIEDLKKAQHYLEKYIEEIEAGRIIL